MNASEQIRKTENFIIDIRVFSEGKQSTGNLSWHQGTCLHLCIIYTEMRRWVQTIFLRCDRESSDPYDELILCRFCRSSLYLRQVPWEHQVFDVNKTHRATAPLLIFSITDRNLKSHTHKKNSTCGCFNKILSKTTEKKKTFIGRVAKSFFNQQVQNVEMYCSLSRGIDLEHKTSL